ncbi:TonB-dependent receptor [bacterium]|nr:TonB-dependent receptor [bacterium]
MVKKVLVLFLCASLSLIGTALVQAAETGNIGGKVVDSSGTGIPGVSITVTSTSLIGTRSAATDENGKYRVPILPVGVYTVNFDMAGYRPLKMEKITVVLGVETDVPATLELATELKEEIVVVADIVPLIDTKTANVATFIDNSQLESLPSGRSFRDIMKFDPGITGVRSNTVDGTSGDGLPSVRGEGQYGNNYLIDGLSVRDPDVRTTGVPLNFDAIDEVQIITDGFNPEYGMALGGIVNVVTKSGGNTYSGEAAWIYESDALTEDEGDGEWDTQREYTDQNPYFNLGGPIIPDQLWFFTSYTKRIMTEKMDNKTVTDDDGNQIAFLEGGESDTGENNLFLKFSYQVNPNNLFALSGTYYDSDLGNQGIDELREPSARYSRASDQYRARFDYKSIVTESTVLEFKFGWLDRSRGQESESGDTGAAQYQNISTGIFSNNIDNSDQNVSERMDLLLQGTQYFEAAGSHELKVGFGVYQTKSSREIDWYGEDEDVFLGDGFDGGTWYQFQENEAGATYLSQPRYYFEGIDMSVENETEGLNFYVQDTYSPLENVNIMLGFRMDTQDVKNNEGRTLFYIPMTDFFSPRMTVTWDITSDGVNIAKMGIGRFYDEVSTSLAEWGNTQSAFSYRKFGWWGPTGEEWANMTEEERYAALHNPNNWGDQDGNTGDPNEYWSEQSGEATPIDYDPDLKPYYKDEWLLEYNRKLTDRYAAKVRYVESHTRDLIEDVAYVDEEGQSYFVVENWDEKRRDYKSYEFEFNGRPTDTTMFYFSYVNSEAKGTNPGQFERGGFMSDWGSGNEVGVFGDHFEGNDDYTGLGGPAYGDEGWYGYLPYSVDHMVKVRGFWQTPVGVTLGTSLEWNSGYHWSKRGLIPAYEYSSFPEGRGSREMPDIYYWDASAEYTFKIKDNYALALKLDIFNITNEDTPISYNEQDSEIFGEVLKTQDPRSIRMTLRFAF